MKISGTFLFGRYTPGGSFAHRLDARVKILILFAISVSLFMSVTPGLFLVSSVFLYGAVFFSGIKICIFLKSMLPVLWLVILTLLLHAVLPPSQPELAAAISLRIVLLVGWASLLTATTPAMDIGRAMAWFLYPLKAVGVSPSSVALTFMLAMRFFPIMLEEAESIMKAQKLRPEKLKLRVKIESFCTVFMIRVMKRASSIEDALEVRDINMQSLTPRPVFDAIGMRELAAAFFCILYILGLFLYSG